MTKDQELLVALTDGLKAQHDNLKAQHDSLASVVKLTGDMASTSVKHSDSLNAAVDLLNMTIHRVEALEAALTAFMKVKGDGQLWARLIERETARIHNLYHPKPGGPETIPFPGDPDA